MVPYGKCGGRWGSVRNAVAAEWLSGRPQETRREGAVLLLSQIRDDVRWCLRRSNFGRPRSFGSLHSLRVDDARWTARRWVGEELRSALGVVMHWSSFARRCGLSDRLIHSVSLRRHPARSSRDWCRIGPASFCFPAWSPARDHESLCRSIIRSDPGRRHCEACPKVAQLQDGEAGQAMGSKWCVDEKSSSREHIDQAGRRKTRRVTSKLKACNACNNGSTRSRDVSSVCPTSVAQ